VLVSELALDGLFGVMPDKAHMERHGLHAGRPTTVEEKRQWLEKCVKRAPRLWRPPEGGTYRLHELNRNLFCLGASHMLAPSAPADGVMLDACDGAGGTGLAMWMGARTLPRRQVIETHESNARTAVNFGDADRATMLLTRDQDPLEALNKACAHGVGLVCAAAGEPVTDHILALTSLKQCPSTQFVALTHVTEAEIERISEGQRLESWAVVASGVDYRYATPAAAPLCMLRLGSWCERVPWVIVARREPDPSAPAPRTVELGGGGGWPSHLSVARAA
jgi:hypothetical protein